MNQDVKTKWAKALRSGDYQQTTGALQRPGEGFCCLGVLCDLAVKEGIVHEAGVATDGVVRYGDGREQYRSGDLPESVVQWAGVGDCNPTVARGSTFEVSLAEMNDGGNSFEEIAQVIETYL